MTIVRGAYKEDDDISWLPAVSQREKNEGLQGCQAGPPQPHPLTRHVMRHVTFFDFF